MTDADRAALADFEATGRLWLRRAVPEEDLRLLDGLMSPCRPGARLSEDATLDRVLGPEGSVARATAALWPAMHPVRAVAFTKDADTNWGVPWHQDRIIAVRERTDAPGSANWSRKAGPWHCEPPSDLLAGMLSS